MPRPHIHSLLSQRISNHNRRMDYWDDGEQLKHDYSSPSKYRLGLVNEGKMCYAQGPSSSLKLSLITPSLK